MNPLRVVVCGDPVACVREVSILIEDCFGGQDDTGTHPSSVVVETFLTPPSALVTSVDLLIVCFSPIHLLSFRNVSETWLPLFSHIHSMNVLLVATRFELLGSMSVLDQLDARELDPVCCRDVVEVVEHWDASCGTITFVGVTFQSLVSEWIGRSYITPGYTSASHTASSLQLLHLVERHILNHPDRAASHANGGGDDIFPISEAEEQWQSLLSHCQGLMEERRHLPEWLEVRLDSCRRRVDDSSDSRSQRRGVSAVEAVGGITVFVSRRDGTVENSMPTTLAHSDIAQYVEGFQAMFDRISNNPCEPYLLRKAMADADRRRAVEVSSRRAAVSDPILVLYDTRERLVKDVKALEKRRDRLLLTKRENELHQNIVSELRRQVQNITASIASEPQEVKQHSEAMEELRAKEKRLEEYSESQVRVTQELLTLPTQRDSLMAQYLQSWNENKGARGQIAALNKSVESLHATAIATANAQVAEIDEKIAASLSKIDWYTKEMNRSDNSALLLEGCCVELEERLRRQPSNDLSSANIVNAAHDVFCGGDDSVAARLLQLHRWHCTYFDSVLHPAMLLLDTEIAPLELSSIESVLQTSTSSGTDQVSAKDYSYLKHVERVRRNSLLCSELQERASLWLEGHANPMFRHARTRQRATNKLLYYL